MKKQYRYYNHIIFIRLEQYENMSIDEDNMEDFLDEFNEGNTAV